MKLATLVSARNLLHTILDRPIGQRLPIGRLMIMSSAIPDEDEGGRFHANSCSARKFF